MSTPVARRRLFSRPWIVPLALLTVTFLVYALPPYLGFDPAESRVTLREGSVIHYPLLVTHILFGSVALLTACLQVWPWLRDHHRPVHRCSGRIYVFAGVLPTALCALVVSVLSTWGPVTQVGAALLGVLWLATTLTGYRMARRRRYAEHREWMVRSFALAFAIVAFRAWFPLCMLLFAPEGGWAEMTQAFGVSMWLSWVVNLLVAEWWLQRTRNRNRRRARRPAAAPVPV